MSKIFMAIVALWLVVPGNTNVALAQTDPAKGTSTADLPAAAKSFLNTLEDAKLNKASYKFSDNEQ